MSILKLASLVVTANAYEESKILAVVPSNGSGDLDFVRASTKSRVNSDGFIADSCKNIFRFSETFTNSYWAKTSSTVTANQGLSPLGTLTATRFNSTSTTSETQLRATIPAGNVNDIYFTSVYVKKTTTRYFRIRTLFVQGGLGSIAVYFDLDNALVARQDGTLIGSITNEGNGWYRCSVRTIYGASGNIPLVDIGFMNVSGSQIASVPVEGLFWGAQLELSSTLTSYLQTTDRLNVPSIDYTGGGCPSILLEPQRTNLVVPSNNKNNITTGDIQGTYLANTSTLAPDNSLTSYRFTPAQLGQSLATASGNPTNRLYFEISLTNSTYTNSIYVKSASGNNFNFAIKVVNIGTDTEVSSKTIVVTNVWQRVETTGLLNGSNQGLRFVLKSEQAVDLWGFQCELGAYATSYILTQASAVTRITDTFRKNNIFTNNFITSLGGTWFVEFKNNIPLIRDGAGAGLNLSANGGYSPGLLFKQSNNNSLIRLSALDNNSIESTVYVTTQTTSKVIIKWNGFNLNVFENGIKVVSNYPFTLTLLNVLDCSGLTTTINLSSLALFPTPLSDEECILLSSTSYNTYQEMATALNYINQ
jgi:hypothetical protein